MWGVGWLYAVRRQTACTGTISVIWLSMPATCGHQAVVKQTACKGVHAQTLLPCMPSQSPTPLGKRASDPPHASNTCQGTPAAQG